MAGVTDLLDGQVTACGICGYGSLATLLDMGDQPLAEAMDTDERYPLILMECGNCSLVQLSHTLPQRLVFPRDHPYATGNTSFLLRHFIELAKRLSYGLGHGDMVVDIGASDGTLLSAVSPSFRRVAVEPTNQALKCLDKGLITYQEFFTTRLAQEIRAGHGSAKVVTATNVLAHVPDVHDFMNGVSLLLGEDGVFVTENHDLASITDGLQFDTIYHEHLRYFSLPSLSRLLAMHGFQITGGVQEIPTHGGSFRVAASRRQRNLGPRARQAARALKEMLMDITTDGVVYGVGAATRATPLIHYTKIAPFITCVCEVSSSAKIGHLMPSTQIPIVDEVRLIEDQPEYALLFSWHIAADLMPKLRAMGYQGRFIIPLPEPRVVDD
jgi:hypothetical protein